MLTILLIAAAVFLGLGTLASVAIVGKPREPITGGVAAFVVLTNASIIALLIWAVIEVNAA